MTRAVANLTNIDNDSTGLFTIIHIYWFFLTYFYCHKVRLNIVYCNNSGLTVQITETNSPKKNNIDDLQYQGKEEVEIGAGLLQPSDVNTNAEEDKSHILNTAEDSLKFSPSSFERCVGRYHLL